MKRMNRFTVLNKEITTSHSIDSSNGFTVFNLIFISDYVPTTLDIAKFVFIAIGGLIGIGFITAAVVLLCRHRVQSRRHQGIPIASFFKLFFPTFYQYGTESPAQTLQVIYLRLTQVRLNVPIACDGLQQKFQHAEYFTCNPSISQPVRTHSIFTQFSPLSLEFHDFSIDSSCISMRLFLVVITSK